MNKLLNTSITKIKKHLILDYGLTKSDAKMAIEKSGVKEIFKKDIEMSCHDDISDWAKTIYKYYQNNMRV